MNHSRSRSSSNKNGQQQRQQLSSMVTHVVNTTATILLIILAIVTDTNPIQECYSFSLREAAASSSTVSSLKLSIPTRVTVTTDDDDCTTTTTAAVARRRLTSSTTGTTNLFQSKTTTPTVVYTIAGSDSGGGAGIQADLKTIYNFHCHGCSIITCLTAQNSVAVTNVHTPPTTFIREQWNAIYNDIRPDAIKIGMLGSKEIVMTVGTLLKDLREQEQQQLANSINNSNNNDDQNNDGASNNKIWIVLDPVMISTSGSRLIDYDAQQALIDHVFPYVDLITPNLYEAQALLSNDGDNDKFMIASNEDMEHAAKKLLQLGCKAVLIKGGHFFNELNNDNVDDGKKSQSTSVGVDDMARDYLLIRSTSDDDDDDSEQDSSVTKTKILRRLCDADVTMKMTDSSTSSSSSTTLTTSDRTGVWFHSVRYDTVHTHGTGCTLSAAIASAMAVGESCRRRRDGNGIDDTNSQIGGAFMAMNLVDAVCLAKAYVTAGISQSQPLLGAKGPGPVAHTTFPNSCQYFPTIHKSTTPIVAEQIPTNKSFIKFGTRNEFLQNDLNNHPQLSRVLPIVDSVDWIERLCTVTKCHPDAKMIHDVQLRIKNEADPDRILEMVITAQKLCASANIRLWINDYWEAAIAAKCFGVHLGQEDLYRCINDGGIERMRQTNSMALGISTHTYGELAAAIGIVPSYISLGPIFATGSKSVQFEPQGLDVLRHWRQLIPPDMPLVAIGGINNADIARDVRNAGADCIAVIGAITRTNEYEDIANAIIQLEHAMLQ